MSVETHLLILDDLGNKNQCIFKIGIEKIYSKERGQKQELHHSFGEIQIKYWCFLRMLFENVTLK